MSTHHIRNLVITLRTGTTHLSCVHSLVRFCQLPQTGQGVWSELRQDTWNEFGEFLVGSSSVDGISVVGTGAVDCKGKAEDGCRQDGIVSTQDLLGAEVARSTSSLLEPFQLVARIASESLPCRYLRKEQLPTPDSSGFADTSSTAFHGEVSSHPDCSSSYLFRTLDSQIALLPCLPRLYCLPCRYATHPLAA